jgi:glycosyltransferase involved in cell wall biosynthesis
MEPNRILLFVSSLRRGGAENHLLNLCRYLRRQSMPTAVCTLSTREDGLETTILGEDVALYRLPLTSLRWCFRPRVLGALRRIVRSCRPDVIHAHLFHAEAVAALATFFTDAPLVVTRHSAGLEFEGWRRHLMRTLRGRTRTVVAVSSEAADEAASMGYRRERIVVVPNGIDTSRFRPMEPDERSARRQRFVGAHFPGVDPDSCLLVGAAGGLKAVKNFPLFVRMADRIIRERTPDRHAVRFVIFGEGDERDGLERLAARLGAAPFIAMPGHHSDPEDVYGMLDVFALTSVREGVPMVLLEAMSSGVACVASDVGGVREAVGESGLMIDSGDEDGFVAAVSGLLLDHEERRELARRARVRALERFDLEIWGTRMLDIYRDAGHRG